MSRAKVYVVKHPGLLSLCCGHIKQSPGCDIVQRVDAWAWIHCMHHADWGIARLAVTHWVIAEEISYANAHNAMSDAAPTDEEATTLDCVVGADASFGDCAVWIGELGRSPCYSNGNSTRKYVLWSHLLLDLAKRRLRRLDYGASHGQDLSIVRLKLKVYLDPVARSFHIVLVARFECMLRRGR